MKSVKYGFAPVMGGNVWYKVVDRNKNATPLILGVNSSARAFGN